MDHGGRSRVGRPLPLAQVGTNKDRLDTRGKKYAIESNKVVRNFGIERRGLVEEDSPGYNVPHLDGIWLRAPYLYNVSVPSPRDFLKPPAERPQKFYRGYDAYDPVNKGFIIVHSRFVRRPMRVETTITFATYTQLI